MLPIRYIEPVFRPPSEAESLILPVTDGCSWNQCTFCEMYTAPQKAFAARKEDEVLESIRLTGQRYGDQVRRVFLADGDALRVEIFQRGPVAFFLLDLPHLPVGDETLLALGRHL